MKDDTFKLRFTEEFYRLWKLEGLGETDDTWNNPKPWGRPWITGQSYQVTAGPKASAQEYFERVKEHIK